MKLIWKKKGKGKQNIILLHGWGLNKEIWNTLKIKENKTFCFHLVDLPGYGLNHSIFTSSLEENIEIIWKNSPKKSIWLGWSLGGLIASAISVKYEPDVIALITVSSSPYFIKDKNWPGIELNLLKNFELELKHNFYNTINRFLNSQTFHKKQENQKKIKKIKKEILKYKFPTHETLNNGLKILKNTDLRKKLLNFKKPFFRIYGELDNLVPKKIIPIIDDIFPNSKSKIIKKTAHAPFLSHPKSFIKLLHKFYKKIKK